MIRYSIRGIFFSLFLLVVGNHALWAQEVIFGDANLPPAPVEKVVKHAEPAGVRSTTPPVLTLPFRDDFSGGTTTPDANFWELGSSLARIPRISLEKGINPPSKGVVTFDGATYAGKLHKNTYFNGEQDTLTSQAIDLSSLTVGNNVWLSFFLQPGGLGDLPEYNDSFYVWFDTTGKFDFEKVKAIGGTQLPSGRFSPIMVKLDEDRYFKSKFHFKFTSFGSLNGELDLWNVDYVYMNSGRSPGDTLFNDASVTRVSSAFLGGHTAMPWRQYNVAQNIGDIEIEGSSLKGSSQSRTLNVDFANPEPVGGQTLSGTISQSSSLNLATYQAFNQTVSNFSEQHFDEEAALRVNVSLNNANDLIPENDTLNMDFPLGNVFAKDDGISDMAYGMTGPKGFCMRFELPDANFDTLKSIWINWAPSLYFNGTTQQSYPMEGKSFRLSVWTEVDGKPNPDTVLFQKLGGMLINYGGISNEFIEYSIGKILRVPKVFYVGVAQNDEKPVGIGFDTNYDNSSEIFYQNSNLEWVNTTYHGTLMIRPDFGPIDSTLISVGEELKTNLIQTVVYPNPVSGDQVSIALKGEMQAKELQVMMTDLQGRVILNQGFMGVNSPIHLNLPLGLSQGWYLLQLRGTNLRGESFTDNHKLIFR
ncbi:MAG: T9SS type A sorting domain-containing protein [Bacteroidia bacterium]|nr:T9SS type A sorting domain-containing protein [Bacteroidia bacterium]